MNNKIEKLKPGTVIKIMWMWSLKMSDNWSTNHDSY